MIKISRFVFLVILATFLTPECPSAQRLTDIDKFDPAADAIVPANARVEKVADGFGLIEGPLWIHQGTKGFLIFSDMPANVIDEWSPERGVSVFLDKSGFSGTDASDVGGAINNGIKVVTLIGSNGITMDRAGRIVLCQQGNRQIVRLGKNGYRTVLVSEFEGKKLNSPNDLVYRSDGSLYFTDPSAGLRRGDKDPKKELPFDGVYRLSPDSKSLELLAKDFRIPNGIAFSPNEKYLYVDDTSRKIIMRYDVHEDGNISNGRIFTDMKPDPQPGYPDGMKVDRKGNLYCTGPGGFWIISPQGKHIATVRVKEIATNLGWGDTDGKTLYVTARTGLYRIRLNIRGIRP